MPLWRMPKNSSARDTLCLTKKELGAKTGLRQSSRTSSFSSMALLNMQNGISASMSDSRRTPNEDTNFRMATSKTSIAAAYLLSRAEQASTDIPESKMQ